MPERRLFLPPTGVQNDGVSAPGVIDLHVVSDVGGASVSVTDGRLRVSVTGSDRILTAAWLRQRSLEPGDVDPANRQRLAEPCDLADDLSIVGVVRERGDALVVEFSDGRRAGYEWADLARWTAKSHELDEPPLPEPWSGASFELPTIDWETGVGDDIAVHQVLESFHRFGCFIITGTPPRLGALREIASEFGRVSATNFGELFDVRSVVDPADLAYTPVGLSAHTDQPYRRPTPGLQFLHTVCNDAGGGESTIVDGLAAVEEIRANDRPAFDVLCDLEVEWRYDIGSDVVVSRAPIIEVAGDGSLRQLRFSPRLDFPVAADPDLVDAWYAARRTLFDWLNDPRHQVEFKMRSGDVIVVDNHRVLHGRRPYDSVVGHRHLQGCYIDHDGPATMFRLLSRRLRSAGPIETENA